MSKKFVFLYFGYWTPTEEIKTAWGEWFQRHTDKFIDAGNPFGPGLEISRSGRKPLPHDLDALVGYSIIAAADNEEAEAIAEDCPIITSVRVYEAMAM